MVTFIPIRNKTTAPSTSPPRLHLLLHLLLFFCLQMSSSRLAAAGGGGGGDGLTLDSIRKSLVKLEDTIIFSLIERANHPLNSRLYEKEVKNGGFEIPGFSGSLFEYIVRETEAVQAKVGRYEMPLEKPFFPDNLPEPIIHFQENPSILHPAADSISVNKDIMDMYLNKLLPLVASEGDDGDYARTAASDLECLQALSRRIYYGNFVAEIKFRDAPQDYSPLIRAQDRDALMKLLTFESVEEMIKKRVEKKAMVFGQDVNLTDHNTTNAGTQKYKIDPSVVSRLYGEWVMPLTKIVEVEYLLRRLD